MGTAMDALERVGAITAAAAAKNNSLVAAKQNNRGIIFIARRPHQSNEGKLLFQNGNIAIDSPCWWDKKTIQSGTYVGAATRRDSNQKIAVHFGWKEGGIAKPGTPIPTTVPGVTATEVMIHFGKDQSWSDACIVLPDHQLQQLWNALHPKEEYSIKIVVWDADD